MVMGEGTGTRANETIVKKTITRHTGTGRTTIVVNLAHHHRNCSRIAAIASVRLSSGVTNVTMAMSSSRSSRSSVVATTAVGAGAGAGATRASSSSSTTTTVRLSSADKAVSLVFFLLFLLIVWSGRGHETELWGHVVDPQSVVGVAGGGNARVRRDSRGVTLRRARTFVPPAVRMARRVIQRDGYVCLPLASVGVPLRVIVMKSGGAAATTLINPRIVDVLDENGNDGSSRPRRRPLRTFATAEGDVVGMRVTPGSVVVEFTDGDFLEKHRRETFHGADAECVQVAMARFSEKRWQRMIVRPGHEHEHDEYEHGATTVDSSRVISWTTQQVLARVVGLFM